ncbi:hypothetical protein [Kitasatospora albolonga]|uniref:hypothetical protein n=1 Tax=Kitasatospora albolonga TaxID=68173 RepID=UPI0031E5A40C
MLCHGWPEARLLLASPDTRPGRGGPPRHRPNQRGYGNSSRPAEVTAYDLAHLTATGRPARPLRVPGRRLRRHDWGAMVVWGLALLHPDRVNRVVNLSLPYQERVREALDRGHGGGARR